MHKATTQLMLQGTRRWGSYLSPASPGGRGTYSPWPSSFPLTLLPTSATALHRNMPTRNAVVRLTASAQRRERPESMEGGHHG
jgi:hypothetical protein